MSWRIESVDPRDDASWIHAYWTGDEPVYTVSLLSGDGVDRTTASWASREVVSQVDSPLRAVFRWKPYLNPTPMAVLTWRDRPDGPERSDTIPLRP